MNFRAKMLLKIAFVKWREYLKAEVSWDGLVRIVNELSMFNGL